MPPMAYTTEQTRIEIEKRLKEKLTPTLLEVIDDSPSHAGHKGAADGGGHYYIRIASPLFAGKTLVEQHKLVFAAAEFPMENRIHALEIKTVRGA